MSFARFYFDADDSLRELVKQWSVQGVPSYRLYDEQGEMTKQFATGTPTKLGNTLYLLLIFAGESFSADRRRERPPPRRARRNSLHCSN